MSESTDGTPPPVKQTVRQAGRVFPYSISSGADMSSAIFALASCFTMGFVRHGDSAAPVKKGLEAFDVED